MDLLKAMHQKENFSEKEQRVIQYILDHQNNFINLKIRELSDKVNVSPPTIVRLCKKLQTKGYDDFKIEFKKQVDKVSTSIQDVENSPITKQSTPYQVIQKVTAIEKRITEETRNEMDYKQINHVLDMIDKANKIILYGSGVNYRMNEIFAYQLLRVGKFAQVPDFRKTRYLSATFSDENTLAFILSHRGSDPDYLALVNILKQRKVKIVSITGNSISELSNLSDEVIYVNPGNKFEDMSNIVFTTSVSYVYDVLFASYFVKHYDKTMSLIKEYDVLSKYTSYYEEVDK